MVPRIHNRGADFRRACWYILHDQGKTSDDRVLWAHTANLGEVAVDDAWRPMYETWKDRTNLKREAGVDLRGRDNKEPVLHFTLAWAHDEKPSPEHMREAALAALKALKLDGHQAVMAAHSDKEHLHVHVIVNTVHPETGRTAPLKHSKLELSRWAEAYEREHGIKCEQRIKNNKEREKRRDTEKKRTDRPKVTPEQALGMAPPPVKKPKKVRDRSPPRSRAVEKKDVIDRMKRLRAEIAHRHMVERDVNYARQREERQALASKTEAAANVALDHTKARFKPRWKELYEVQRQETAHVGKIQVNLFERAVFVFWNAERLAGSKPLSFREKVRLITSPKRFLAAVDRMHGRERSFLSAVQKFETKRRLERIWVAHDQKAEALKQRLAAEHLELKTLQKATEPTIDYRRAKNQLILERQYERPVRQAAEVAPETDVEYTARIREDMAQHRERNIPQKVRDAYAAERESMKASDQQTPLDAARDVDTTTEFNAAAYVPPPPALSRAEQIKRDMANYRQRNPGHDLGREFDP